MIFDVIKAGSESEPINSELAAALKRLWMDKGVSKLAYQRGNEFQLPESAA